MSNVTLDGIFEEVRAELILVDVINRSGGKLSQVCYHVQLGLIQNSLRVMPATVDFLKAYRCHLPFDGGRDSQLGQILFKAARANLI